MREWADWQIGDNGISMQAHVSAESDSAELGAQSKHLEEMCCREIWGDKTTSHCPVLFLLPIFFYMFVCLFVFWVLFLGLVSVWVVFGWWCTCLLHSSHAAWYGNNVSRHDLQLSVSVIFKLLTGWLPSMLVPCCSGDIKPFFFYHSCDTCMRTSLER